MAVVFLLIGLIVFAAIGVPLAFSIGASCISYLSAAKPMFLSMMPQRIWNGVYSELMIAMPLFMLAGELMNTGGITKRIINFCMEILRPIHGGLGEVNIVASMIFGGISGSSVADTSALGSILIPAMEEKGYPKSASAGITVASSTMGMIIPPSTPMVVYAMVSGASIGALFMAGAVPGLLIGLSQLFLVFWISHKKGWHPAREQFSAKRFWHDVLAGIPALLMPIFIIVCVSGGGRLLPLPGAHLEGRVERPQEDAHFLLLGHDHHRLYPDLHLDPDHPEGARYRGQLLHEHESVPRGRGAAV